MKKTLLFAFCLLLAGTVSAQQYFFGPRSDYYDNINDFYRPRIGIEGGVSMSNTSIGAAANSNFATGSLTGFNVGLTFDLPVTYPITFAPEVLFSEKGYAAVTNNGNFTQHTDFIDVPLLAKFEVNPMFSLYVGPQFSYLAGLHNNYASGFAASTESYYTQTSNYLFFDAVVGASFALAHDVELRARYTIDLQQNYSNGNAFVPSYATHVVQLGLGYKF